MSAWKTRRFWTAASVAPLDGEFAVHLDGRPVRTPAKAALKVPSRGLAEAIAAEWQAQDGLVDPTTMPATRAANAAIDRVAGQRTAVVDMLAAYGDTDLTCYRASGPQSLIDRQIRGWEPLLDWAAETFGARLLPVEGVVHVAQPGPALRRLREPIAGMGVFELTGFHDLVCLSGSLIIGLATVRQLLPVAELWARSRIDEVWQEEQWGRDAEAAAAAETKAAAFADAARFVRLSRTPL